MQPIYELVKEILHFIVGSSTSMSLCLQSLFNMDVHVAVLR